MMRQGLGASRPSGRARAPAVAALVTLALGVVGAWLCAAWQARTNEQTAADRFNVLAGRAAERVRARLATYEYGLRGARGTVLAGGFDELTLREFQLYSRSRDVDSEFPGARGMGIIRRVPHQELPSFLEAMHRGGRPDFELRQLTPHAREHYVIQFIEPVGRNRQAVGLDIGSEATRREAAATAMATGQATLTGPITLVQATGKRLRSFLLLLPIYRDAQVRSDPSARRAAAWGWSYAPLVMDEVLADVDLGAELWIALRDLDYQNAEVFFTAGPPPPGKVELARRVPIRIYGRRWQAELRAMPAFVAGLNLPAPRGIGLVGTLLATLLAGLVFVYTQSAQRAAQVRAEQARRAAIVASSSDAIIGETPDGIVTDWNEGAVRLFGYSAEQALGRSAASLLLPPEREDEDAKIRDQIARGEHVLPFDSTRRTQDGRLIDVAISASPIAGPAGQRLGFAKTIRDISVAKRAERRVLELNVELEHQVIERTTLLEAARRDLRNILDAVPSMIGYWDRDLKNRFANHAYGTWFGVEPASIPGMHARELLGLLGPAFEANLPRMQAALRGEMQAFEVTFQAPYAGTERHAITHYVPDAVDGEIRGFYVIVFDITEQTRDRARLAAALRENEALLSTIRRHAIVSVTDRDGRILDVNDNFCRISQYTREDLIGQSHSIINSNRHDRAFWGEMWRTIAQGQPWHGEVSNRAKDGSLYWVESMIAPIMGDNGAIDKYLSIGIDVTARKRVEYELVATHARMVETSSLLRAVLESASEVSMIATDPNLVIKVWNSGAQRLLGYSSEEVVGRVTPMLIHDAAEVRARCEELSARAGAPVEGGEAFIHPLALREAHEWTYLRKDGTRVPVSLTVTAMRNDAGELFGYLGVAHDVTQQKQYADSLRDAMEKAEQASQAKSQFLANMSHEIRTPMNAVIGLTYLLGQTALDSQQGALLSKIQLASDSLLALINDILDLSKIEARQLSLEHVVFDLHRLLAELCEVMKIAADQKGIAFHVEIPEDLPDAVNGDATRLRQILANLLSNAIKFTDRGSVRLRAHHKEVAPRRVELYFEVEDTGIGVSSEQQARLFAPFAQADTSTTRRFGGTGLGLSIVKRLANMMSGEAGLRSQEGIGSTFWVRIEVLRASASALPNRQRPDQRVGEGAELAAIRVLVVDDNELNLSVAQRILELHGVEVSLASNGQQALQLLSAQPDACDVVLMDVQMPVLDGREAARRIREELKLTLPIIALTADAQPQERQRALAAGMNDFVTKPFEPSALVECIRRHTLKSAADGGVRVTPMAEPASAQPHWPDIDGIDVEDARMRLADDAELFRGLLTQFLADYREPAIGADASVEALQDAAAQLHSLRGAAGQLGAKPLHDVAAQAEAACRRGDAEWAAQLAKRVGEQLARLRVSLASQSATAPRSELETGASRSG